MSFKYVFIYFHSLYPCAKAAPRMMDQSNLLRSLKLMNGPNTLECYITLG